MNSLKSYQKPAYVQENNLIIFPRKRSKIQESIIKNQSFNVGSSKRSSRNFYTANFLSIDKAIQEAREWAFVSSGLSHYKRSLLVIDCDTSQSICEFYDKIVSDMGIEPNYIRHHKTNGHNQAGFFHNEINIFNESKHREYLDIVNALNEHFHKSGWEGWKIQNPYFESDEYETCFFHNNEIYYNDIVHLVKKFPEYADLIKKKRSKQKSVKNSVYSSGTFIDGKYVADFTWCGNSRHRWILAKTNEEIINHLNAFKCMPTVDYVVNRIYNNWPSSYNKVDSYTIQECIRDVENQIRTFKPSSNKEKKDKYSKAQRLVSMQKRHLQKLVKVYNMLCLIENKYIKSETARKEAGVTPHAYKEYRKSSINQIIDEILESISGLKEWGKLRDKSFESLVKNIRGLSHSSPLYEKMEQEYDAEKEIFEQEVSENDCYMEKIYSAKDMFEKRRYVSLYKLYQKGIE